MAVSCICEGGLCNQLFQVANCYAYALRHNLDYCIPIKSSIPHYQGQPRYIFPGINYCDHQMISVRFIYKEKFFHYQEIPKFNEPVVFKGYFQSWRYSIDKKDAVLKAFGFDDIKTKEGVCSIHYRGGDYNNLRTKHPPISEDYLKSAIMHMDAEGYKKFLVFSDEMATIKKMINSFSLFYDLDFEYSVGNNELDDLKLMASCASNITANSSFSLWAAYTNPNPDKKIVMPGKWFGEKLRNKTEDIYLPTCEIYDDKGIWQYKFQNLK